MNLMNLNLISPYRFGRKECHTDESRYPQRTKLTETNLLFLDFGSRIRYGFTLKRFTVNGTGFAGMVNPC